MVLRNPEEYKDEEVFLALCHFDVRKLSKSPVVRKDSVKGRHLFSEVWRIASVKYRQQVQDLFTACFGKRVIRHWHPLANAIFYQPLRLTNRDYMLDECRSFHYQEGIWRMDTYEKLNFDRDRFQGFLHETDLRLRRYLNTGRYLRTKSGDEWADPFIGEAIKLDRQSMIEASKPKIKINMAGLEEIRRDARKTQDSLLSEEERVLDEDQPVFAAVINDTLLNGVQLQILDALLQGESADGIVKANHLMASVVADTINEILFEKIGDIILLCENDRLALVEDYRDDVLQIRGGIRP